MARERYLVGVNEEELTYKPYGDPMTGRGKLANFWYYHKGAIIGGAVAVALIVYFVVQAVTRVKPDYQVCLVTMDGEGLPNTAKVALQESLERYGEDRNGDGDVVVNIQYLHVVTEGDAAAVQQGQLAWQTVSSHVAAHDVVLYVLDDAVYQKLAALTPENQTFLQDLGIEHDRLSEDGTYYIVNLYELAKQLWDGNIPEKWETVVPDSLYLGVRYNDGKLTKKQQEETETALALVRKFIAAQPPVQE